MGRGSFGGGASIVKCRDTAVVCAKMAKPVEMLLGCGLRWVQGIVLDGVQIPYGKR